MQGAVEVPQKMETTPEGIRRCKQESESRNADKI